MTHLLSWETNSWELLCVMAFQEMQWASVDGIDVEDFDLSNVADD